MPNTPDSPVSPPDPDFPGEDFLFSPTPDFLGDLDPLGLVGLATSPAPKEWKAPGPVELTAVLPGYAVIRLIGQGGMGAVYEAHHTMTDRTVALKFLPADRCASDPAFAERARREVRLLSSLSHPNIVTVFDSSTTAAGDFYFTMELVQGETLAHLMRRSRPGTDESMAILREVCDAIAYAHSKGLIHRDLKPSNIIIGNDGKIKVVDFGLAVPVTRLPEERLTRTGIAVGTYEYCAPEQLAGEPADAGADIYSLGVITYQLLTGELPVGAFDPPSLRRKAVAQGFDHVVMRALLPDPAGRYQTTQAFRDDLESAYRLSVIFPDWGVVDPEQSQKIQDHYEKNVSDVPSSVRIFIEDKLLTPSGYRDSRPLDDALVNHGIQRAELDRLVERHLLRIEERAGIPRVEISHDRLTGAIQASRDIRRAAQVDAEAKEREARLNAEAKERERRLRRQMQIRVFIALLGGLALTLGGWGYSQYREAQRFAADERTARSLLHEMTRLTGGELAESLEVIARLDVLKPVIKNMDDLFSRYPPAREDTDWNNLRARFLVQKSSVFSALGEYTAAGDALREALSLSRGLDTPEAVHARTLLMRHLSARGRGLEAMREWPALTAQLQSLPETAAAGYATALAEDARSRAQQTLRNREEAVRAQLDAITGLGKALTDLPAENEHRGKWEHELALMHLRLANLYLAQQEASPAALAAARQGNQIAARLAGEIGADPRWRATHARSWSVIAWSHPADSPERKNAFDQHLNIARDLTIRDPENILWLREYTFAQGERGSVLLAGGQWDEAARVFDDVIKDGERIVKADPSVEEWRWDQASYHLYRGYVDFFGDRPGHGKVEIGKAISLMESFVASTDAPVPGRVSGLGAAIINLGAAMVKENESAAALNYYTDWIARGRRQAATGPPWHFLAAVAGWEKGDVQAAAGDIPAALRTFAEAIADLERAYQLLPRHDWPAQAWAWRHRPALILTKTINAAGPADQAEAKRVGAAVVELLLRFSDGQLPEKDATHTAVLQNLVR